MKQIRTSGVTAATVLVAAILGGAVGGAMVAGHDPAPLPAVSFDQAAQTRVKQSPAKRAEAAAKRAEKAADRATKAAVRAEAAAMADTAPMSTPAPTTPKWDERGAPYVPEGLQCYTGNPGTPVPGQGGTTWYCVGGKYQSEKPADPPPAP